MRSLFLLILIFIASCGNDDMKKYSRLEGLRILAITADSPEINAPATVNLTPFLSYTDGGDTTLDISYEACLDPGISYGAQVSCDTYESSQKLTGSTSFDTSILGSANYYTGNMTAIPITIPPWAFVALSALDQDLQFNGVDMIVIFTITDQSDSSKKLKSIKRISLTTKSSLNTNPSVSDILGNANTLNSFPNSKISLSMVGTSEPESYEYQGANGLETLSEKMTISWFSNVGEMQFSRTDKDESVIFDPQKKSEGVIVGVYRDNRGGVAIVRKVY